MKLLKLTSFYSSYLDAFYHRHPGLDRRSFAEQKAALDYDAFGWADYWTIALSPLGYEVMEVTLNAESMQRAWAKEHSFPDFLSAGLQEIAIAQLKQFKPEILWFDEHDAGLLERIRLEIPSIRLVLGWSGSSIVKSDVWRHVDLILSCAPEAVRHFQEAGCQAAHLNHGFDPRINERLAKRERLIDFSFIGQLLRFKEFHLLREQLLTELAKQTGIAIYSPEVDFTLRQDLTASLMGAIHDAYHLLKKWRVPESIAASLPIVGRASKWEIRPLRPVNPALAPFKRPAVFGLEMYQVLRDSKITLNIHADSSPIYASNMRLFETTGVGACMVVDWKENLAQLFEPDAEVVAYRNPQECIEKVKWLLRNPEARERIAHAGRLRTLKDHSFERRAMQLDEMIRSKLSE